MVKWDIFDSFFKHRFDMGKTKILKNHIFTTCIFNYIWTFLVKIKSVCSMVILEFSVLYILPMLWTIKIHVLEPKFYRKSSFWSKKDIFLAQITIGNRFFPLSSLIMVLWTSKCHFWKVEKVTKNQILSGKTMTF